jgi:hypothetical protein
MNFSVLASRHVASAGVDSTSKAIDDKKKALRIRLPPVAMSLFQRTLHRGHGSSDQFKITRLSDSSCEVSAGCEQTESDLQYVASMPTMQRVRAFATITCHLIGGIWNK